MNKKEMLKRVIEDNMTSIVVSEIDMEYYKQKEEELKKMKEDTDEEKEAKKGLIQDNEDNMARVKNKIETLRKWVKIAERKLQEELKLDTLYLKEK